MIGDASVAVVATAAVAIAAVATAAVGVVLAGAADDFAEAVVLCGEHAPSYQPQMAISAAALADAPMLLPLLPRVAPVEALAGGAGEEVRGAATQVA